MWEFIINPWPWWFSGLMISGIMFTLIYFGQSFGFSSNLRTICAISGLGKKLKFFDFNWKSQMWNITFMIGAVIGGFIAGNFLSTGAPVNISTETIQDIATLGIAAPAGMQPEELFGLQAILTPKGFLILALGGLMVGFGSRYAGGCTSGHAISGLSDLQWPSLITVIGFFTGGLLMTYFILPIIF